MSELPKVRSATVHGPHGYGNRTPAELFATSYSLDSTTSHFEPVDDAGFDIPAGRDAVIFGTVTIEGWDRPVRVMHKVEAENYDRVVGVDVLMNADSDVYIRPVER